MRKLIRLVVGIYAIAMVAWGGWQIFRYYREAFASDAVNGEFIRHAVVEQTNPMQESDDGSGKETVALAETKEQAPIKVDFDYLKEESEEIVAWLYLEGSIINYPVAQAADNQYYLNHLPDGTQNSSGTLFVDYRNSDDFSDWNTVIYGHNMKNDTAFGTLDLYKEPEYYAENPVMWLLTPEETYKLELIAGYVTPSDSQVYLQDLTQEQQMKVVMEAVEKSTFDSGIVPLPGDRFVTLSTCSYEYSDARYVLIGRLIVVG